MRFRDIPQFPRAGYSVHVGWDYLERHIANASSDTGGFVMCPDYQRGHVWTEAQQIAFVEYGLMGGESSMVITTNCPGWGGGYEGPHELVDGLQRVTAVLRFVRDEIQAFGSRFSEYEDKMRTTHVRFEWRVLSLPTRGEVLRLYLLMNSGGVVHSAEEISRVRALLEKETP
jgi:hypothetical protein